MDQTIAKGSFIGCERDIWCKMSGVKGNIYEHESEIEKNNTLTINEQVRHNRKIFLDKLFPIKDN